MNEKFYHFQSLAKDEHLGYLKKKLQQQIWLTPLDEFNDPFEGQFFFENGKITPKEIFLQSDLAGQQAFLEDYRVQINAAEMSDQEVTERLMECLDNPESLERWYDAPPLYVKETFAKFGAFCFTPDVNNIPMWANYADNHKGICVVFEIDFAFIQKSIGLSDYEFKEWKELFMTGEGVLPFHLPSDEHHKFNLFRVRYGEKFPTLNGEALKQHEYYERQKYLVKNAFGYKSKKWEHENEFRLIANSNGDLDLQVYAKFIKVVGVILGISFNESNKKKVEKLCKNYNIKLYQASCSKSEYGIAMLPYHNHSEVAVI